MKMLSFWFKDSWLQGVTPGYGMHSISKISSLIEKSVFPRESGFLPCSFSPANKGLLGLVHLWINYISNE